jgi:peptidoglycan/LPS O-acetylase OafA/YrhL
MLVLLVMCVAARVPFDRKLAPLLVLLMVWLVGGCLAAIQVGDQQQTIQYVGTSFYLCLAAIMFACLFGGGDPARLSILRRGLPPRGADRHDGGLHRLLSPAAGLRPVPVQ